ncbi:MAG: 50S ribosomal protein L18 [Candidatus Omnitrophica bacterium CG07_land_8_20_14_0_80_42_15]|uniref:Large ribosomal subunit protein uL18 n=1 Tax=Candidatus Aquitaenariimonas noxiae TaxID=1974741 RepID=A0A2J0KVG3_9BACT|nr:MAG: 50S ribosomal protein L18 [Candidatus Omnitrophica bacterium CG07_land_8_20_14_0_80_42_15]
MLTKERKKIGRFKRHTRVRTKITGDSQRPRLSVFRSHMNLYAQIINDLEGKTIISCSTLDKVVKSKIKSGGNISAAAMLGEELAKRAQEKGIKKVTFDRGGYLYHGSVKVLAEALRKAGLEF